MTTGSKGRTLRIFLTEGAVSSILTAEIINWTGRLFVAPRSKLPELLVRPELGRTGIYLLVGPDPQDNTKQKVYVGEGDSVKARLLSHNSDESKDFFSRICVVVSTDANLTKGHVRYLERRLIGMIDGANRATLANGNGTGSVFELLPESDLADMEYFVEQLALVLPVLGFDFILGLPTLSDESSPSSSAKSISPEFEFNAVGVSAKAREIDGEFIVKAGSTARLQGVDSWTSYRQLRDKLMKDKKLVPSENPEVLRFAEDTAFDSPSAAAAVVAARNSNGRMSWKVFGTGQTYAEWQESQLPTVSLVSEAS